ncbi:MAG: hypothetical protein LAN62_07770 [Acidobacteriia bacterium]|nr:hypothetical protein [Terriglobia bacterium]
MSANAQRWLKSLIAVVAGNALYFSLSPYLPPGARHEPFALDWGVVVDFWVCLSIYGLLDLAIFLRKRKR